MLEEYKIYKGIIQVSNLGNLKSLDGKPRKSTPNDQGYRIFNVGIRVKNLRLHRVVAETFIPNPNNYTDVNHIDGDKSNNRIDNLEWCTRKHNIQHAYDIGLRVQKKGSESPVSKLSVEEAQAIYDEFETDGYYSNTKELAEKYGIHQVYVRNIITGKNSNGTECWSEINRNRVFPEQRNTGQPKAVNKIDLKTGEILATYESVSAAKRAGEKGSIGNCAGGKSKSAGGYLWQYK